VIYVWNDLPVFFTLNINLIIQVFRSVPKFNQISIPYSQGEIFFVVARRKKEMGKYFLKVNGKRLFFIN